MTSELPHSAPASLSERHAEQIAALCRFIESRDAPPTLAELATQSGLSSFHLHRLFKSATGLTPKGYAEAHRAKRVRAALEAQSSVTEAIYSGGFSSSGRFYAQAHATLGMTPGAYRRRGLDVVIRFAIGECSLGSVLVAATEKGVCAVLLGDDPEALAHELERRFGKAELVGGDAAFEALVAQVVGLIEQPQTPVTLPLDIRGTAFQQRVWTALRKVPVGRRVSYAELAAAIGSPKSVRAVAGACAANPIAIAIPCHRVIRTDGGLSGYRWGVERKRLLLERERPERG